MDEQKAHERATTLYRKLKLALADRGYTNFGLVVTYPEGAVRIEPAPDTGLLGWTELTVAQLAAVDLAEHAKEVAERWTSMATPP